jgi:hypothetical protein
MSDEQENLSGAFDEEEFKELNFEDRSNKIFDKKESQRIADSAYSQ